MTLDRRQQGTARTEDQQGEPDFCTSLPSRKSLEDRAGRRTPGKPGSCEPGGTQVTSGRDGGNSPETGRGLLLSIHQRTDHHTCEEAVQGLEDPLKGGGSQGAQRHATGPRRTPSEGTPYSSHPQPVVTRKPRGRPRKDPRCFERTEIRTTADSRQGKKSS